MKQRARLAVLAVMVAMAIGPAWGADTAGAQPGGSGKTSKYAFFDVKGSLHESLPPVYLLESGDNLHELLGRIDAAGADPDVQGLIVKIGPSKAGWAKVEEIRDALVRAGQRGKDTVCLLDTGGNLDYYLATGARRIVMPPAGLLLLSGLRAEALFARDLLDKLGIRADLVQAGKYKGAGEPLMRRTASSAFRESLQSLLDGYYEGLLDAVAAGRDVPVSQAEVLLRGGPYSARQALEAGLIDDVLFMDELVSELGEDHGGRLVFDREYGQGRGAGGPQAGTVSLFSLLMGKRPGRRPGDRGPAIAVLYAVGPIIEQEDDLSLGEQAVSLETFLEALIEALSDDTVKAIVLRVDSPGGSAQVCDSIWRELRQADKRKPVIASFSDTAASGGYYIGVAARKIYAQPGTLTGSIGVLGGKLVMADLLAKIGVSVVVVERGIGGGFLSPFQEFSASQRKKIEELIDETYRLFLERVEETRPQLSAGKLRRVAQGRVWTGRQAHEHGLVDELGGLAEAIKAAKVAAGLAEDQAVRIVHLPRPRSVVELIFFGPDAQVRAPDSVRFMMEVGFPRELGSYLRCLIALRRDAALCVMPAAVIIR